MLYNEPPQNSVAHCHSTNPHSSICRSTRKSLPHPQVCWVWLCPPCLILPGQWSIEEDTFSSWLGKKPNMASSTAQARFKPFLVLHPLMSAPFTKANRMAKANINSWEIHSLTFWKRGVKKCWTLQYLNEVWKDSVIKLYRILEMSPR